MWSARLRKPAWRVALVGLVLAVAGAATWLALRPPFFHWVEVVPGKFYRSGLLRADLGRAIDRYGLKTVVNVRSVADRAKDDWYEEEKRITAEKGVRLVDVPLEGGMPPDPAQVAVLLALFDDPASMPVLVHCRHGEVRSAAVEALYRREYLGESGEEALAHVSRQKSGLATEYPKIAEFVRGYVPRKPAVSPVR